MGMRVDYKIAQWQKKSGIKPASGEREEALRKLQLIAFELIKRLEHDADQPNYYEQFYHRQFEIDGDKEDRQIEALNLIRVLELEISGIRDGDGYWYGCDVIGIKLDRIYAFAGELRGEIAKLHAKLYPHSGLAA